MCVCVYVCIFFHRGEGFFCLQDVCDIIEELGQTILCFEYSADCFLHLCGAYLKMSCNLQKDSDNNIGFKSAKK